MHCNTLTTNAPAILSGWSCVCLRTTKPRCVQPNKHSLIHYSKPSPAATYKHSCARVRGQQQLPASNLYCQQHTPHKDRCKRGPGSSSYRGCERSTAAYAASQHVMDRQADSSTQCYHVLPRDLLCCVACSPSTPLPTTRTLIITA
jgi:hypothetical protein